MARLPTLIFILENHLLALVLTLKDSGRFTLSLGDSDRCDITFEKKKLTSDFYKSEAPGNEFSVFTCSLRLSILTSPSCCLGSFLSIPTGIVNHIPPLLPDFLGADPTLACFGMPGNRVLKRKPLVPLA